MGDNGKSNSMIRRLRSPSEEHFELFELKMRMMSGECFDIALLVSAYTCVKQIMSELQEQMGIPYQNSARLSYNGQAMDFNKTLGDYGITGNESYGKPVTLDVTIVNEHPPWPREDSDWDY